MTAIQYFDDEHEDEDRFLMIGMSTHLQILIVVHVVREAGKGEVIRIISARPATKCKGQSKMLPVRNVSNDW